MQTALCVAGTAILVLSVVLCTANVDKRIWLSVLVAGEIIAWLGAAPVLSKLF